MLEKVYKLFIDLVIEKSLLNWSALVSTSFNLLNVEREEFSEEFSEEYLYIFASCVSS